MLTPNFIHAMTCLFPATYRIHCLFYMLRLDRMNQIESSRGHNKSFSFLTCNISFLMSISYPGDIINQGRACTNESE